MNLKIPPIFDKIRSLNIEAPIDMLKKLSEYDDKYAMFKKDLDEFNKIVSNCNVVAQFVEKLNEEISPIYEKSLNTTSLEEFFILFEDMTEILEKHYLNATEKN